MTIGAIVALVVGAVVIVGAVLVVVRSVRRRLAAQAASMAAEVVGRGERIERVPEHAVYRGGSGAFSGVKGNGTLILTDRAVEFRKLTGPTVRVAREDIRSVAQQCCSGRRDWRSDPSRDPPQGRRRGRLLRPGRHDMGRAAPAWTGLRGTAAEAVRVTDHSEE